VISVFVEQTIACGAFSCETRGESRRGLYRGAN